MRRAVGNENNIQVNFNSIPNSFRRKAHLIALLISAQQCVKFMPKNFLPFQLLSVGSTLFSIALFSIIKSKPYQLNFRHHVIGNIIAPLISGAFDAVALGSALYASEESSTDHLFPLWLPLLVSAVGAALNVRALQKDTQRSIAGVFSLFFNSDENGREYNAAANPLVSRR